MANVVEDRMNSGIKILPPSSVKRLYRRADERVEVMSISCPWDGKLSLKADEAHFGQRQLWKENGNTTTLFFFLERTSNFTSRKKRTSENYSNGTLIIVLCSHSPNTAREIKSRRLRWAANVARMEEGRSVFKILTGNLQETDIQEGLSGDRRTIL